MSENAPNQASSQEDLDQLSALDESMASIGIGELYSDRGVILKDWSAQDFAHIYVRFRPHLISHARKFLKDETQAEEVVQDAFLYLMTALPELDSELGVLRFLKWKSKMLCFDIIRSSQAGLNNNLVPLPDDVADETQPLDSLERADDAAIIRLALAKLNPRHRHALIASIYEEKSHEEVARELGVGQNAFRQLLFRARASFRQALVGEAEIQGKTQSQILAIAARRSYGKTAGSIGVSLALIIGFTFIDPLNSQSTREIELANNSEFVALELNSETEPEDASPIGSNDKLQIAPHVDDPGIETSSADTAEVVVQVTANQASQERPRMAETKISKEDGDQQSAFAGQLGLEFAQTIAENLASQELESFADEQLLRIVAGQDLTAYIALSFETEALIQHVSLIYSDNELGQVTLVPTNSITRAVEITSQSVSIAYVATDFLVGDLTGKFGNVAIADAPMRRSALLIDLSVSEQGEVLEAHIDLIPRS